MNHSWNWAHFDLGKRCQVTCSTLWATLRQLRSSLRMRKESEGGRVHNIINEWKMSKNWLYICWLMRPSPFWHCMYLCICVFMFYVCVLYLYLCLNGSGCTISSQPDPAPNRADASHRQFGPSLIEVAHFSSHKSFLVSGKDHLANARKGTRPPNTNLWDYSEKQRKKFCLF